MSPRTRSLRVVFHVVEEREEAVIRTFLCALMEKSLFLSQEQINTWINRRKKIDPMDVLCGLNGTKLEKHQNGYFCRSFFFFFFLSTLFFLTFFRSGFVSDEDNVADKRPLGSRRHQPLSVCATGDDMPPWCSCVCVLTISEQGKYL